MIARLSTLPILIFFIFQAAPASAQLEKITFDLNKEKPEKFQNRTLRSEKTGEKKFTVPRRFIQNTVSHYNYYFNASNKINSVIERARIAQQDDYTKLLPFYSYSIENTSSQKNELDSVIQKATAGILLHDLRSNWVDNFYMLIGKAYFLRKDFDSAYMAFQFINYNLYPRNKKNEDERLIVGSNENKVSNALSVANKEDRKFFDRILSKPPSRNDALLWQVRALTHMGHYAEASGLINTLQNDPNFPQRLQAGLDEAKGFWFYQQQIYDSAIAYIVQSLPAALDLQDQARREFLLAQLYERKESMDTAAYYYSLSIRHTTNPLMDIYANLNKAKLLRSDDDPAAIKNSVAHLLQMARKDKYHDYRDVIYYAAGELALDIPDTSSSLLFYTKSTRYNQNNLALKNQAFLQMADISYQQKNYLNAYNYYDSLQAGDSSLGDMKKINDKKSALAYIVRDINIINREDSLQQIAAMPTADRDALLKKLSRKLRKERGLEDSDGFYSGNSSDVFDKNKSPDLFASNNTRGDWYFYNNSLKSKGYGEFVSEWGKRQNVDNWRRVAASNATGSTGGRRLPQLEETAPNQDPMAPVNQPSVDSQLPDVSQPEQEDVSVEGLRANLPLTQLQLDSSNGKAARAYFALGKNYQNLLEDYSAAVDAYETSLQKFPDSLYGGELYMNLSYCYKQLGDLAKADFYKNLLTKKFATSAYADYLLHPEKYADHSKDTAAARRYDDIYLKFIEGKFAEAVNEKKLADSTYGSSYWNPQLLYIESVYYIRQREDSMATAVLNNLISKYPESPMKEKAANLIGVLSRRDSIENYLTNLQVERMKDDSEIVVFDDTRIYGNLTPLPERNDSNLIPKKITTVEVPELKEEKKIPAPLKNKNFMFDPFAPQNVVMVLTKVDPVYSSEARNAFNRYNKTKFYNQPIEISKDTLDSERTLLIFSEFVSAEAAIKYMERLKHDAPGEVSWLPSTKYAFYIISNDNLELLKENKKLESYLELLKEKFPGKF